MTEILNLRPIGVSLLRLNGKQPYTWGYSRSREIRVCARCGARRVDRA